MQAKPDNEDCNHEISLEHFPPSRSQVAPLYKTKGGLDYLSFDDLYNKLRTLEIDVKGDSVNIQAYLEDDDSGSATGDATGDVANDVSNAAAEFALMGISSQAKLEKLNDKVKLEESKTSTLDVLPEKPLYDRDCQAVGNQCMFSSYNQEHSIANPSNHLDLDDTLVTLLTSPQTQRPLALHPVFQVSSPQRRTSPFSLGGDLVLSLKEAI
ncbi:hypothetical protein Tco_0969971 [Tanacetum coccineum]